MMFPILIGWMAGSNWVFFWLLVNCGFIVQAIVMDGDSYRLFVLPFLSIKFKDGNINKGKIRCLDASRTQ